MRASRARCLAMLALNEGSPVSAERLIDGLWENEPPATAPKMVQVYVSQLRKALAGSGNGAEIVTRGRSYELRLGTAAISTSGASSVWWLRGRRAPRWRSGAARRSTTWPASRSPRWRSAGSRSCGCAAIEARDRSTT